MKRKPKKRRDPFKATIITLLTIMLAVDIAMMVWAVRRDERAAREQQEAIERCQQGCYTYSID